MISRSRPRFPDLKVRVTQFTKLDQAAGSLIPPTVTFSSGGTLRLSNFHRGTNDTIVGGNTWINAFVGQSVGDVSLQDRGRYFVP